MFVYDIHIYIFIYFNISISFIARTRQPMKMKMEGNRLACKMFGVQTTVSAQCSGLPIARVDQLR